MYEQLTELQPDRFECTSVTNLGELIQLAGLLYECGRFISFPKFHRHSYYMIFHSRLPGLNQKQRQWIALIARHHRKSICRADRPETSYIQDNEIKVINSLAGILRLVSSLYRTREDNITSLGVHESNGGLHFEVHFTRDHNPEVCLLQAQLEVPNLRKAFGCNVRVSCTNQALSST
jgi:exopolyphosphatase/guanosine-5'-triphosphate,3'-diphosphate pyrophosphatase